MPAEIEGGYVIEARHRTLTSPIFTQRSALDYKLYRYIQLSVEWSATGHHPRGTGLFFWRDVRQAIPEATSTGWKNLLKWLVKRGDITTEKRGHGVLIRVHRYAYYQDATNYRNHAHLPIAAARQSPAPEPPAQATPGNDWWSPEETHAFDAWLKRYPKEKARKLSSIRRAWRKQRQMGAEIQRLNDGLTAMLRDIADGDQDPLYISEAQTFLRNEEWRAYADRPTTPPTKPRKPHIAEWEDLLKQLIDELWVLRADSDAFADRCSVARDKYQGLRTDDGQDLVSAAIDAINFRRERTKEPV